MELGVSVPSMSWRLVKTIGLVAAADGADA
jgi:hypothetical protein